MPPRGTRRKPAAAKEVVQEEVAEAPVADVPMADENGLLPAAAGVEGLQEEVIATLLQDLEAQVEARCRALREKGERLKAELRTRHSVDKLRIPRSVRAMPLVKFLSDFNEDARAVLRTATAPSALLDGGDGEGAEPPTAVKGARGGGAAAGGGGGGGRPPLGPAAAHGGAGANRAAAGQLPLQTPSKGGVHLPVQPTPGTAARLARQGEMVLSANGSPLMVPGTAGVVAAAAADGGGGGGAAVPPIHRLSTVHSVLQQEVASLAQGNVEALPDDMRRQAFGQLQSLQDQITRLMSQLA